MGHYFGLFHTFQNGCVAPGDSIEDTPPQGSSTYGNCFANAGKNTCPGDGDDDISNFMDYRYVGVNYARCRGNNATTAVNIQVFLVFGRERPFSPNCPAR